MSKLFLFTGFICFAFCLSSCDKDDDKDPIISETFQLNNVIVDGTKKETNVYENVNTKAPLYLKFSAPVDRNTAIANLELLNSENVKIDVNLLYENNDSTIKMQPTAILTMYSSYKLTIYPNLKSKQGSIIITGKTIELTTGIDSTDKFPRISDNALLELVQKQTFKYFWELGHPTSGMARERSTSGNTVTTGGTGFGIMAMVVAAERNFITRMEAVGRIQKIATFLKTCTPYHGAFAHWINGESGITIPFSANDNGADLVETSFLMQGLLTARQYFNGSNSEETQLRNDINQLWQNVEWDWFRKNNDNCLYWHWSPNFEWEKNHKIQGWNECMITYVLAACSPTHSIPKEVYDQGWARNGNMKNGQSYYGYVLPLGNPNGGPLFFTHYSFLGLNPKKISDQYANYWTQNRNHALINRNYCIANPQSYQGYSADCWGLTASDGNTGYSAHSPNNDKGVIAPTAALASMPYTPEESMRALHFYYYKLGDLLWKEYGFIDAFNLSANWFDTQFLAIDQGPIVVMIENHRSGLIWNLFMSCPEVQPGLTKLGIQITN